SEPTLIDLSTLSLHDALPIYSTRGSRPPLRNCAFPRAGEFHRPGIAELYARESSIAQELRISTRGKVPPLRNRRTLRAGVVHRSRIAESHAQEWSIAQESRRVTRGMRPSLD